jgi:hypothetical protein
MLLINLKLNPYQPSKKDFPTKTDVKFQAIFPRRILPQSAVAIATAMVHAQRFELLPCSPGCAMSNI